MHSTSNFRQIASMLLLLVSAPVLAEATLSGTVLDSKGAPLPGAQVTLISSDELFTETVYSDAKGQFVINSRIREFHKARARKHNYRDAFVDVDSDRNRAKLHFRLSRLTNPDAISAALTASAHFSRIQIDDAKERGFFRVECLTCHQLGNAYTRAPRSAEHWRVIVDRMLGFYGIDDERRAQRYVTYLESAFDGTPLNVEQKIDIDDMTFASHITQWKLPGALIAHDVEYHSKLRKFFTVDQGRDKIYVTDPAGMTSETYDIPTHGMPIGGKFLRLLNESAPFSLSVRRGPHSLQEGPDGKYYTTDTISGQIGVFDPYKRTYEGIDIGGKALYPHTIRFDQKGMAWFTISVSNQVGRLDPETGEITVVDLPVDSDRPEIPAYLAYGIDVHPLDGSVWYSRLMANRIGRIDPITFKVQEFIPPLIGPRRLRFDRQGNLWIPAYGSGEVVKLDTKTMTYTNFTLPGLSTGELDAPYAVGVHPETQEVWITANMSDRMFRFLPDKQRFVSYPLPTRGIFLRDVIFTEDDQVCAASSMSPAALAVEGGMEEIVCIAPDRY